MFVQHLQLSIGLSYSIWLQLEHLILWRIGEVWLHPQKRRWILHCAHAFLCFQFPVVLLAFSRSKSDSWCKMHHKQLGGWIIFAETRGQDQLKNCMAWIKNITGEMVAVQAGWNLKSGSMCAYFGEGWQGTWSYKKQGSFRCGRSERKAEIISLLWKRGGTVSHLVCVWWSDSIVHL